MKKVEKKKGCGCYRNMYYHCPKCCVKNGWVGYAVITHVSDVDSSSYADEVISVTAKQLKKIKSVRNALAGLRWLQTNNGDHIAEFPVKDVYLGELIPIFMNPNFDSGYETEMFGRSRRLHKIAHRAKSYNDARKLAKIHPGLASYVVFKSHAQAVKLASRLTTEFKRGWKPKRKSV